MSTLIITGAGISIASGIRPFRGEEGIWNENPTSIATLKKYYSDPLYFLKWYYHRMISGSDSTPNTVHQILARKNFRVITQNIDNLHLAAGHNKDQLIEIHGNLKFKRPLKVLTQDDLILANWDEIKEPETDLKKEFNLSEKGKIIKQSLRPHVLLFDEYYTELYQYSKAKKWVEESSTIIFMGTSNSVGFTDYTLSVALSSNKKVIVVDPNPSSTFFHVGVEFEIIEAEKYCHNLS